MQRIPRDLVIVSCLDCDWWEWGREGEGPGFCPECGGGVRESHEDAMDTIACMEFHRGHE